MKTAVLALAFSILGQAALAHSALLQTWPSNGAFVDNPPDVLQFTFGSEIRLTQVQWTLNGSSAKGTLTVPKTFETDFAIPFDGEDPGQYTIEWRGLSDDGHPQNGIYFFEVK